LEKDHCGCKYPIYDPRGTTHPRLTTCHSFIEANLLIMCCCLPTLRGFFKHFAPRLIGETSSTGRSSRRFSNKNAPRTFGSSGTKRTRDTFKSASNEPEGFALSSFDDMDKGEKNTVTNVKNQGGDNDSEEAILFERSVNVTYENASQTTASGVESHHPQVWAGDRV
jgi:hypothetical protein